jgi:hypothetical protein
MPLRGKPLRPKMLTFLTHPESRREERRLCVSPDACALSCAAVDWDRVLYEEPHVAHELLDTWEVRSPGGTGLARERLRTRSQGREPNHSEAGSLLRVSLEADVVPGTGSGVPP